MNPIPAQQNQIQNEFESFYLDGIKHMAPEQAKRYIDKYFIPLSNGLHAQLVGENEYELKDEAIIRKVYFKRMQNNSLTKYYFEERGDVRDLVYKFNQPVLTDRYLNMCPPPLHQYKPFESYDEDSKNRLNFLLNYVKTVLANNDDAVYDYLLKWSANVIRGVRNNVALYLKGMEGTGKSTYFEFIRKYVLGNGLSYQGGSRPLTNGFNYELSHKVLSIFEELESVSAGEWMQIGSVLKRIIDSSTIMIEKKGVDPIEQHNMNNFVIISNHDAVKDDDGRKYFVLDVNPIHCKDYEFYGLFHKTCSNNQVGEAFYSYLLEIDLTGFLPAKYPATATKSAAKVKRLDNVFQFIKKKYILCRQNIDRISVEDLYQEYVYFSRGGKQSSKCKIDFNKQLSDVGIKYFKSGSTNYYKVSIDTLDAIAKKFQWIGELDVYDDKFAEVPIDDTDYKALYLEQQKQLKLLQDKLAELERKSKVVDQEPVSEPISEPVSEPVSEPKKKVVPKKKTVKKSVLTEEEILADSKLLHYNDKNKLKAFINQPALQFSN